jgi:mRNA interferase MazF
VDAAFARLLIEPEREEWAAGGSYIMLDMIVTVPKLKLGQRLAILDCTDAVRLNRAVLVFLGLGASPREERETPG